MATYSVDERRPRCMDSFGGLRADRTKMKRVSDEVQAGLCEVFDRRDRDE
ncbi:MAG: hypothetical protein RSC60_04760 [Christensenellaceae bacterium]